MPGACCTRGLVCKECEKMRTRAYRYSRSTPAFPAQGSQEDRKAKLNQRRAGDVSTSVSRFPWMARAEDTLTAIESCGEFGSARDKP